MTPSMIMCRVVKICSRFQYPKRQDLLAGRGACSKENANDRLLLCMRKWVQNERKALHERKRLLLVCGSRHTWDADMEHRYFPPSR
jgi:hypothetical protein